MFQSELSNKIEAINGYLAEYLPKKSIFSEPLREAMEYSLLGGGKRVRAILLMEAYISLGGTGNAFVPFACAMEMIHTYSLIHDDLPAMDDDDFRRGKPTNHKVYGEAVAILAGDALLNLAYETMANACIAQATPEALKAMKIIADAAGSCGMVGGQAIDIVSENKAVGADTLLYIHENKTGALFAACLEAGAVLAGKTDAEAQEFGKNGRNIGLAFQIQDDCLNITSSTEIMGKTSFSDEKNNKTTYISVFGIEKARQDYSELLKEAYNSIEANVQNSFLLEYIKYLESRKS